MRPPWNRAMKPPGGNASSPDVEVPQGRSRFSTYAAYFGPAIIAAVAYIDPGNFGTDIQSGAQYGYLLLWAVLLANLMGMLLQYLSGKLGLATDQSLGEMVRRSLGARWKVVTYWLACEVFALFTDLAEFLGVTSAVYLLSDGRISLLASAWLSAFDVIVIFALLGRKFRRIEVMITTFVFGIGLGYVYELVIAKPNPSAVAHGIIIPTIANSNELFLVVGIIGATVMPHVLMLHSSLTKQKSAGMDVAQRKRMLGLHRWDTIGNLTMAGLINMAILIMAAAAFYVRGLNVVTINDAYTTLTPLFGVAASVVFALTLMFSGWSSSTVGVIAGQSILEGLLGSKASPWLRRILLRVVNVIPTSVAIMLGYQPLVLLVYSQVVLSLLIPLPLIPLIYYTSKRKFMGEFVNRHSITFIALLVAGIIIVLNALLLVASV